MKVPNTFPFLDTPNRIALIGEAPGKDEVDEGKPFVGASGRFLNSLLQRAGIPRESCFVGNVCQLRPPGNEIASFDWMGEEIQSGIRQLKNDLDLFKPNIIIAMGGTPIHALRCPNLPPKRYKQKDRWVYKWPYSPILWRGSLFRACDLFSLAKAIGTVHPAYVLQHDYAMAPLLLFDLKKAVGQSGTKELVLPQRFIETHLTASELYERLDIILKTKTPIAIDIEGGIGTMSCISFADSAKHAFIVPLFTKSLQRVFSLDEEKVLWSIMAKVLEDPLVPKVLQNSLYDRFVLEYSYGIRVHGVTNDTMLKHWEYYCELEKALDVQTSLYTNEPYYKGDRKSQDDETFFRYCCLDSLVTYEINDFLEPRLSGTRREHYRFNISLLDSFLDMEMRGFRYDSTGAWERRQVVRQQMFEEQAKVNALCGVGWQPGIDLFSMAVETMGKKRRFYERGDYFSITNNARKEFIGSAKRLDELVHQPFPNLATLGEIEDLLEIGVNVGSNAQMCDLLYRRLELPVQHKRRAKGQTSDPPPTADYEALLKLCKHCNRAEDATKLAILQSLIKIRSLGTRERMLGIHADADGRIRCGYNEVGTNTGRISCYESPTGSGYNLQTIPEYDRDLFLADEGHWMAQLDLKGADGWTVAAYAAMMGDRTMLDDYLYGLKPAQILVLALEGVHVDFTDRAQLKEECKKVSKSSWNYFAMKRVQHGASYLEGEQTISDSILTDSEGALFLEPKECRRLRDNFFFKRYSGIPLWHRWLERRMSERPTLIAASGHVRHFFGRKDEILTKACAFEPQHNTTYATKLALWRLWSDPDNQPPRRITPLHTVHDSLIVEFDKEDTSWAVSKLREYFDNPLVIAGQRITIPFDGTYGPSWGEQTEGVI